MRLGGLLLNLRLRLGGLPLGLCLRLGGLPLGLRLRLGGIFLSFLLGLGGLLLRLFLGLGGFQIVFGVFFRVVERLLGALGRSVDHERIDDRNVVERAGRSAAEAVCRYAFADINQNCPAVGFGGDHGATADDADLRAAIVLDLNQQLGAANADGRHRGVELNAGFVHFSGNVIVGSGRQFEHRFALMSVWIVNHLVDLNPRVAAENEIGFIDQFYGQRAIGRGFQRLQHRNAVVIGFLNPPLALQLAIGERLNLGDDADPRRDRRKTHHADDGERRQRRSNVSQAHLRPPTNPRPLVATKRETIFPFGLAVCGLNGFGLDSRVAIRANPWSSAPRTESRVPRRIRLRYYYNCEPSTLLWKVATALSIPFRSVTSLDVRVRAPLVTPKRPSHFISFLTGTCRRNLRRAIPVKLLYSRNPNF